MLTHRLLADLHMVCVALSILLSISLSISPSRPLAVDLEPDHGPVVPIDTRPICPPAHQRQTISSGSSGALLLWSNGRLQHPGPAGMSILIAAAGIPHLHPQVHSGIDYHQLDCLAGRKRGVLDAIGDEFAHQQLDRDELGQLCRKAPKGVSGHAGCDDIGRKLHIQDDPGLQLRMLRYCSKMSRTGFVPRCGNRQTARPTG